MNEPDPIDWVAPIHGDPNELGEEIWRLAALRDVIAEVGYEVVKLLPESWEGHSADAFQVFLTAFVNQCRQAEDAHEDARAALSDYLDDFLHIRRLAYDWVQHATETGDWNAARDGVLRLRKQLAESARRSAERVNQAADTMGALRALLTGAAEADTARPFVESLPAVLPIVAPAWWVQTKANKISPDEYSKETAELNDALLSAKVIDTYPPL